MFINALFLITLFIIGAAVGSFTSVVIYRLHSKKKDILRGRSHCPNCEKQLHPMDLIPIVSYLSLRGECRYCSKSISYMYPLLELVTGGLFALLFLKFPFYNTALQLSGPLLGMYLLNSFYIFVLVFTFFFDLKYLRVADEILLPAILIGLIATLGSPVTPYFLDALIGVGIAVCFFGLQYLVSEGKWIGLGDARVGAFMGAILGWKLTIVALFVSYLVGSAVSIFIVAKKKKFIGVKVPFAPMLVTGTLITMFFGDTLLKWYLINVLGF